MNKNSDQTSLHHDIAVIYSNVLKTIIRNKDGTDQQRRLRVTVECVPVVSPLCQKVLCIKLSDDDDPYFVYAVNMSEEEYASVKEQQSLLVDFKNFFDHVVRLFDQCMDGADARFILVVTGDDDKGQAGKGTALQVMEVTHFKHLCHLSLTMNGGSDVDIKKHMVQKIKLLQDKNQDLQSELTVIHEKHDELLQKLEANSDSYDKILSKVMEEKTLLHSKLSQELIAEKENCAKALVDMQTKVDLEKHTYEDKYLDCIKSLETQISSLKNQLQTSEDKNTQAEVKNMDLKRSLADAQTEANSVVKEIIVLKNQNAALDRDYHEKEKAVQSLRTRFAVVEQELKDKSEMLVKEQEAIRVLTGQKVQLEEALLAKEGALQRQYTSLRTISEDFVKANEVLTLHQKELVSVKSKLQLSTNIAFEQEKILDTKSKKITEVMDLLELSKKKIKELEKEECKLIETLQEVEKDVIEKDKKIVFNKQDRLNRRMSETQAQASSHRQWPHRLPQQHLIKNVPSSIGFRETIPGIVNNIVTSNARDVTRSRIGIQMPIKTTGPPQLGFVYSPRPLPGSIGASTSAQHLEGSNLHASDSSKANILSTSCANEKGENVPDQMQLVKKAEPKDTIQVPGSVPRANAVPGGGIMRNPNPPPFSAYFNNPDIN